MSSNWQAAADLCHATGETLPIVRSESEVDALCALVPDSYSHLWVGIRIGAKPNVYVNYLDQSPSSYLENYKNMGGCGALVCIKGREASIGKYGGLVSFRCPDEMRDGHTTDAPGFLSIICENPRKYILFNVFV